MNQPNFFRDNSPFLNHPLLTPERTKVEVDQLRVTLDLPPTARILDVGCGFGRHSIELARHGFRVVGLDPSKAMIAIARQNAAEAQVEVDFQCQAGQDFVAEAVFDAAICLFTTLGQISETSDNSGLVARVYEALVPEGQFVVEVPQREATAAALKPSDRFGGDENYADVVRKFDPLDQTITESFTVVRAGQAEHFLLRYRLFSVTELTHLLQAAGFRQVAVYADYQKSPLTPDSSTMLAICRK